MTFKHSSVRSLLNDRCGAIVVEFALTAPILAMMVLGIFEVGMVVARQTELQSAASEIETIVLATNRGAETNPAELEKILMTSLNLPAEDVSVIRKVRCGISPNLADNPDSCAEDEVVSSYLVMDLNHTYLPTWTGFGIGREINLSVNRTVQIS